MFDCCYCLSLLYCCLSSFFFNSMTMQRSSLFTCADGSTLGSACAIFDVVQHNSQQDGMLLLYFYYFSFYL